MNKRLKQYLSFRGLTVAELEREIGVANGTLGRAVRTGGAIGTDKLEKILSLHSDLSAEWLMRGEGEMIRKAGEKADDAYSMRIETLEERIKSLTRERDNYWGLIQKLTEK